MVEAKAEVAEDGNAEDAVVRRIAGLKQRIEFLEEELAQERARRELLPAAPTASAVSASVSPIVVDLVAELRDVLASLRTNLRAAHDELPNLASGNGAIDVVTESVSEALSDLESSRASVSRLSAEVGAD